MQLMPMTQSENCAVRHPTLDRIKKSIDPS